MTRRSSLDRSDVIHSASRSADSATNRREAADFEVPSPAMTGRSPSGSRTARLSLRVDTLISIRFMAQRPSQSSACGNFMAVVTAHPRALDLGAARRRRVDLHEPSGSQPVYLRSKPSSGLPADLGPANTFNRQFGG